MKCLTHRLSLQSIQPNFQKKIVSPKMEAILKFFAKPAKFKNACMLKTVQLSYFHGCQIK